MEKNRKRGQKNTGMNGCRNEEDANVLFLTAA